MSLHRHLLHLRSGMCLSGLSLSGLSLRRVHLSLRRVHLSLRRVWLPRMDLSRLCLRGMNLPRRLHVVLGDHLTGSLTHRRLPLW